MRWMQIVLFIIFTIPVYGSLSQPKKVVGFKHISTTHKPNCNCVTIFNNRLVPNVIEADAEAGFVKFKDIKTGTMYIIHGDVQIYPIIINDDGFSIMDKSTINHLKRKYLLLGF